MARPADQSGIIRTRRDRNNPYAMVNKAAFEDERLSWEARGVLAYLLTKPDDWQVRTNDLLNRAPKCGGDKLARILKELEDAGYLVRERKAGAHGRFEWVTTVYENPIDAAEVREKTGKRRSQSTQPLPENPVMDKPHQEATSTITGLAINGSAINGKPAHIVNTESSNLSSTYVEEREKRVSRATRAPKQSNLDSFHQAVTIYKELSGKRTIAPAVSSLIASRVTDLDLWRHVVESWCSRYRAENVDGMLDWYDNPRKMDRKGSPAQERVAPTANMQPQRRQEHAATDTAKLAELRAKRNGTS